jgi:hypothetical protein
MSKVAGVILKFVNMKRWLIVDAVADTHEFQTPELAYEALELLGVGADEIDAAVLDMFSKENNIAVFATDGSFEYSDKL